MIDVNLVGQAGSIVVIFPHRHRNLSDLINHLSRQTRCHLPIDRAVSYATVLLYHSTQHSLPVEGPNGHRS
jgi:hypothetical protein